jgi:ATPase subunit of ABC transporter with duplicated ATPase domains
MGVTTSQEYFPKDNSEFFNNVDLNLVDWLRQFSEEKSESFIRGFLGRMLFSEKKHLKKLMCFQEEKELDVCCLR